MGAVLYIRVSTDEQARQGVSLEAQEERLLAYCTMRDLEVAGVIRDEGVSAFKHLDTRPGGAELLALIAKAEAAHVVTLKLDRLFRNAADALAQTEEWNRAGVAPAARIRIPLGAPALSPARTRGHLEMSLLSATSLGMVELPCVLPTRVLPTFASTPSELAGTMPLASAQRR